MATRRSRFKPIVKPIGNLWLKSFEVFFLLILEFEPLFFHSVSSFQVKKNKRSDMSDDFDLV